MDSRQFVEHNTRVLFSVLLRSNEGTDRKQEEYHLLSSPGCRAANSTSEGSLGPAEQHLTTQSQLPQQVPPELQQSQDDT